MSVLGSDYINKPSAVFARSRLFSPRLHLFDQYSKKHCNNIAHIKIKIYKKLACNLLISTSLLQLSVSHDPSEIITKC